MQPDCRKAPRPHNALVQHSPRHVVAEAIETAQQRELVLAQGCTVGQGHLFSRPTTAAAAVSGLLLAAPAALASAALATAALAAASLAAVDALPRDREGDRSRLAVLSRRPGAEPPGGTFGG